MNDEWKPISDTEERRDKAQSEGTVANVQRPRYRSHKKVYAHKIATIVLNNDGSSMIVPDEEGYEPIVVSAEYVAKHDPKEGGYWVQYADGYESWSPAEAFENGYTRIG